MPTRYVDGTNGNDAWDGLAPNFVAGINGPKRTLNGAEDTPVVAGDKVWVRSGVYRELLTCDVSGGVGTPIVYEGDVLGQIWGPGGAVRITGSNNDLAAVRANCINLGARAYRTFLGFTYDTTTSHIITSTNPNNIIIEDFSCQGAPVGSQSILIQGAGQAAVTIRRGIFFGLSNSYHVFFSGNVNNAGHLIQNCTFLQNISVGGGILVAQTGGVTVNNCLFMDSIGIRISGALAVGQTMNVNNCNFYGCGTALQATVAGELVENFNNFWLNTNDRLNVNVGANSTAYPPLFAMPILNAGAAQVSGFRLPQPALGELSSWSALRAIAGTGAPAVDLLGIARPVTAAKNSWGPVQFQPITQDAVTVRTGTLSQEFSDAGRRQLIIPVQAVNTTITVYVWREANYAGVNPQMILKQSGQADITITDAGGAGVWNQLTHTWLPPAVPTWIVIELVSNNTAAAGAFAVYFDDLTVSPLDTDTQEAWLTNEQPVNYAEELAAATAAFSPVGGEIVGA